MRCEGRVRPADAGSQVPLLRSHVRSPGPRRRWSGGRARFRRVPGPAGGRRQGGDCRPGDAGPVYRVWGDGAARRQDGDGEVPVLWNPPGEQARVRGRDDPARIPGPVPGRPAGCAGVIQSVAGRPVVRPDRTQYGGEPRPALRGVRPVLDVRRDDVHPLPRRTGRRLPGGGDLHRTRSPGEYGHEDPDGHENALVPGVGRGPTLLRRRPGVRLEEHTAPSRVVAGAVGLAAPGAVPGRVPERVQDGAVRGRAGGGVRRGETADGARDHEPDPPGHRRRPPADRDQEDAVPRRHLQAPAPAHMGGELPVPGTAVPHPDQRADGQDCRRTAVELVEDRQTRTAHPDRDPPGRTHLVSGERKRGPDGRPGADPTPAIGGQRPEPPGRSGRDHLVSRQPRPLADDPLGGEQQSDEAERPPRPPERSGDLVLLHRRPGREQSREFVHARQVEHPPAALLRQ
ncbi:MAG: hypothetical protein JWO38_1265 [Gemmataceae bacterium]|nr:hypothetical protein [Gemmataceae bacterium]